MSIINKRKMKSTKRWTSRLVVTLLRTLALACLVAQCLGQRVCMTNQPTMGGIGGSEHINKQAHLDAIDDASTRISSYQLCMHHANGNQLNYRYSNGQTFYGHPGIEGNTGCHPWTDVNGIIVEIYVGTTFWEDYPSVARLGFTLADGSFVVTGVGAGSVAST